MVSKTNYSELYRLHEKRETIATLKTVATPKQPQPAPKREEKKRLPIVLGDATIRGSLQEIVNCLGAADLAQAKEALIALDFSRLLRTVTDSSQPGWRPAADILPTLGVYRVRVVGDYLVLQIQAVFPDGGAVVINRFGDYEDQSYIVWARAEGNGAFRLLARPFQHQGDPLSTKTFKVSGFTKAMKALPTAILNTC